MSGKPTNGELLSRSFDLIGESVLVNRKPLELTKKEFDLLYCFVKHPGQVFSRNQIDDNVRDHYYGVGVDETVKVHIKTLHKKLSVLGKKYD